MSLMQLNINVDDKEFLIEGQIGVIVNNRRAKYYLADFLGATFRDDIISIKYNAESQEDVLNKIRTSLSKYAIEYSDSELIREVLSSYYQEQENFAEFSLQARGIWDNQIDSIEFKDFRNRVEQNLKERILYPKQFLAAYHLAFSQNACNFSVPGAGKTSVVYGAYSYLRSLPANNPKHVNRLLIIGPLSSFGPWEKEYEECFGRKVKSKRLSGGVSKIDRDNHLLSIEPVEESPELTLMSYQSVSFNLDSLKYFLRDNPNNRVMVVLDEAHKIKNIAGGVWAESVLSISRYCKSRVVLTGTPAPNGYEDIYNLYEFIWPKKKILNFNTYQLKEMSGNRFDARIDQLVDNISPFFIRIRKSDLNLPPIQNHDPITVQMGQVQREIYDFIENQYMRYFEDNEAILAATDSLMRARFIRLMQAATNPIMLMQPLETFFEEQGLRSDLHIDDSEVIGKIMKYKELEPVPSKFIALKKLIKEIINNGGKVIVWGTFIRNIKELQNYLRSNNINSELLIGEVPVENDDFAHDVVTREKIIDEFHNPNSSFKVIIANPFAVAESISLHKACHHAIYMERTFNASNFIQSKDRIHRVGLDPDVVTHYHYILSENSIDSTIHRRLDEKEQRMLELIESQEIPLIAENLDFEIDLESDVKAIIRDYVNRTSQV